MFLRIYAHEGQRLPIDFETFVDSISNWPGMFCEMDGSFVWSTFVDQSRNQIDGMIYDRDGAIEYVELKGSLTIDTWQLLMRALSGLESGPTVWDRQFRVHDVQGQAWKRPSQLFAEREEGPLTHGH